MKIQVLLVFVAYPFAFKLRARGGVKKIKKALLILILFVTSSCVAQKDSAQRVRHNQIKINAFNSSVFGALDLSYEYLLNENQSVGIGILSRVIPLTGEEAAFYSTEISDNRTFSTTAYYRYFFSKKYAKGFFVEVFSTFAAGDNFESEIKLNQSFYTAEEYEVLAFGLGVGWKMALNKKFSFEGNLGLAPIQKNITSKSNKIITRGGGSFGFRF